MSNNPRYKNSALRNKQRQYWKHRGWPCGICGQPIDYSLGMVTDPITGKRRMHPMAFVIDEIIPVSRWREGGYSSPEACAQDIANQRPAHYICNGRRGDGTRGDGITHVVIGAPCSGKTTYAKQRMQQGDVLIDLDAIAHALGYPDTHGVDGYYFKIAQAARTAAIREATYHRCTTWIIHTAPSAEQLEQYNQRGAVVHVLDPGEQACIDRARIDNRPAGTVEAIRDWYSRDHCYQSSKKAAVEIAQPFADW